MTTPSPEPTSPPAAVCAACGAAASGRFCSHCGASLEPALCATCRSPLSPGARFCHRCGAPRGGPAGSSRERVAWIIAGSAVLAAVLLLLLRSGGVRPAAAPEMGNAGNAGPAIGARRAPDISAMSPEQRFDALYDRVVRASENGDTAEAQQFTPMALGAYALLDSTSNDLRFHAALIRLVVGDAAGAAVLADSILAETPGHLLAYVIRAEVAERQDQSAALAASYRDFLAHVDAELRAGRKEYADHRPVLDDLRVRAEASVGRRPR